MSKKAIWSNDVDKILRNDTSFEGSKEMSGEEAWEAAYDKVWANLDKQVDKLDSDINEEIFLIGELQRWNGRFPAYTGLGTSNIGRAIQEALSKFGGDDSFEIFIEDGKMIITQLGHDNPVSPSVFEFRILKDDFDEDDLGSSHEKNIEITESISPMVSKILGLE